VLITKRHQSVELNKDYSPRVTPLLNGRLLALPEN